MWRQNILVILLLSISIIYCYGAHNRYRFFLNKPLLQSTTVLCFLFTQSSFRLARTTIDIIARGPRTLALCLKTTVRRTFVNFAQLLLDIKIETIALNHHKMTTHERCMVSNSKVSTLYHMVCANLSKQIEV